MASTLNAPCLYFLSVSSLNKLLDYQDTVIKQEGLQVAMLKGLLRGSTAELSFHTNNKIFPNITSSRRQQTCLSPEAAWIRTWAQERKGVGKAEEESFSFFFIFKASSILGLYLLFCLAPGVKGLIVMETGGHRFIALPLDAGLICLVVSICFLSLSHPGPQPPPACELPLQDLGKLLCSGRCRPQPIGGASARP